MLNDLQDRQEGDVNVPLGRNIPNKVNSASPYKNIIMIIITVAVTLAMVYVYYLQQENQNLTMQAIVQSQAATTAETTAKKINQAPIAAVKVVAVQDVIVEKYKSSATSIEPTIIQAPEILVMPKHQQALATPQIAYAANKHKHLRGEGNSHVSHHEPSTQAGPKAIYKNKTSPAVVQTNINTSSTKNSNKNSTKSSPQSSTKRKSAMSITRHQLAPEVLAKQKMSRAKEALANNNIIKAEQIFEDVLLILPSHKDARKQLAALWFGRQSYQAANNLLAQGIYLAPTDKTLRLLNAQIFIKQNQHQAAFNTLKTLPDLALETEVKYLTILATEAQISKNFIAASNVYKRLSLLRPDEARWILGSAIAHDSNSEFLIAKNMYQQAYQQENLSLSAKQFIEKRLMELGE